MISDEYMRTAVDRLLEKLDPLPLDEDQNKTIGIVYEMVIRRTGWPRDKASRWMTLKNPAFGSISPMQMVKLGKGNKVIQWIRSVDE